MEGIEEVKESQKFTPGPWYPVEFSGFWILNDGPHYEDRELLNEEGCENAKQNAILAAAAPDMYEALKKIIEMNRQTAEDKYGDAEKAEDWSCVTVARSALLKAEGKTQNS